MKNANFGSFFLLLLGRFVLVTEEFGKETFALGFGFFSLFLWNYSLASIYWLEAY